MPANMSPQKQPPVLQNIYWLNYNHDADITWLLDYYRIYIVTMTNPDGRKHAEDGICWRKNTNITNGCLNDWDGGTDLNRNHSFHWGGASNDPCARPTRAPNPYQNQKPRPSRTLFSHPH